MLTIRPVRDQATLEAEIADSAEAVVRTSGQGVARAMRGEARTEAELAVVFDILSAALAHAGAQLGIGQFRDAVLTFEDSVVVLGRQPMGSVHAVLTSGETAPAWVLNQLRRLLQLELAEEDRS